MWLNAISTFGTFWLVACWLACSSWLFTFGLLPEKAGKELHVPGVNLGAWPEENMSHLCSSVQQKNMSVMSCKIRWFVSLLTSGGFNFWSWKEPKLKKTVCILICPACRAHTEQLAVAEILSPGCFLEVLGDPQPLPTLLSSLTITRYPFLPAVPKRRIPQLNWMFPIITLIWKFLLFQPHRDSCVQYFVSHHRFVWLGFPICKTCFNSVIDLCF